MIENKIEGSVVNAKKRYFDLDELEGTLHAFKFNGHQNFVVHQFLEFLP